jgi:hypothetical protein
MVQRRRRSFGRLRLLPMRPSIRTANCTYYTQFYFAGRPDGYCTIDITKVACHLCIFGTSKMADLQALYYSRRVCIPDLLWSVSQTARILAMTSTSPDEPSGSWDSIHVFETAERGRQAHYKLTSTVMLELVTKQNNKAEETFVVGEPEKKASQQGWKSSGEVALSGSMTRQVGVSRYLITTYTFTLRRPSRTGPFTNRLHILRIQER